MLLGSIKSRKNLNP